MTEPKCKWCKGTRVVQLLTSMAPCTDCPPERRVAPPVVKAKNYTITIAGNRTVYRIKI